MKIIWQLLIIGMFASVAHAEPIYGQANQPLTFTNSHTNSVYYSIKLEANMIIDFASIPGYPEGGYVVVTTLLDSNTISEPNLSGVGSMTNSGLCLISPGSHTITSSSNLVVPNSHPASIDLLSTISFTVEAEEYPDYTQILGDLQTQLTSLQSNVNNQGTATATSLASQNQQLTIISSSIAMLQSVLLTNKKKLKHSFSDKISSLKDQAVQLQTTLAGINQQLSKVDTDVNTGNQGVSNSATQNTAAILSAINGVSQQVTAVNNNVTTGNKQNQTLEIIGISLGAAGIGAGVGIPFLMKSMNDPNSETDVNVVKSPESDRESINYVSTGGNKAD